MSNSTLVYTTKTGQPSPAEHARITERIYSAAVDATWRESAGFDDQVDDPWA